MDAIEGRCPTQCLFRQEPYRRLKMVGITSDQEVGGATVGYGHLNGDGLADRVYTSWFTGTIGIQLQSAGYEFRSVGEFGNLTRPQPPIIYDIDQNGLNDIVVPDVGGDTYSTLSIALQIAPGEFSFDKYPVSVSFGSAELHVADFNLDGCPDLLALETYGLSYLEGMHCVATGDLSVSAAFDSQGPTVKVAHVSGTRTYAQKVVRVDIAPASGVASCDPDRCASGLHCGFGEHLLGVCSIAC